MLMPLQNIRRLSRLQKRVLWRNLHTSLGYWLGVGNKQMHSFDREDGCFHISSGTIIFSLCLQSWNKLTWKLLTVLFPWKWSLEGFMFKKNIIIWECMVVPSIIYIHWTVTMLPFYFHFLAVNVQIYVGIG